MQYLPFGEPRVDQRTTAWNSMFTFSGKERDEESSYSYFGARYYDSDISIWLSVDPRAGSYPSLTPYNYCANSPVMYTDPNGESITALAVFGIIAAGLAGTYQGITIGIDNNVSGAARLGYGLAGGLISSSAAFAGAFAGAGVSTALGANSFIGNFTSSYVSGVVSGTLSTSGMAWLGGASFSEGLSQGLIAGQIAGIASGVMSGISGGINAKRHGGNFWTGEGAMYEHIAQESSSVPIQVGEGMTYDSKYANEFRMEYFPNAKYFNEIYADGRIPAGTTYRKVGDYVLNSNNRQVLGVTRSLGLRRGSDIYLFKQAFTSKEQLYLTMGHELLHAAHFYNIANVHEKNGHSAIYGWQSEQAKAWNFHVTYYDMRMNDLRIIDKSSPYHYSHFGFSILKNKPW